LTGPPGLWLLRPTWEQLTWEKAVFDEVLPSLQLFCISLIDWNSSQWYCIPLCCWHLSYTHIEIKDFTRGKTIQPCQSKSSKRQTWRQDYTCKGFIRGNAGVKVHEVGRELEKGWESSQTMMQVWALWRTERSKTGMEASRLWCSFKETQNNCEGLLELKSTIREFPCCSGLGVH
jgi:hypothetical protein